MKSIVRIVMFLALACYAAADFHEDDTFNFPGDQVTPLDNERQPWGTGIVNAPQNSYQQPAYHQDYAAQTTTPGYHQQYQPAYHQPSNDLHYHAYPQTAPMQIFQQYGTPTTTTARPYAQQQYGVSFVPSTTAAYAASYETTTTSRPYHVPQQQYMQVPMQHQYAPVQPTTAAPYAVYETTTTPRPYIPHQQAVYAQYSTTTTQRPAVYQPATRPVYTGPVIASPFRPVYMMMTPTRA